MGDKIFGGNGFASFPLPKKSVMRYDTDPTIERLENWRSPPPQKNPCSPMIETLSDRVMLPSIYVFII